MARGGAIAEPKRKALRGAEGGATTKEAPAPIAAPPAPRATVRFLPDGSTSLTGDLCPGGRLSVHYDWQRLPRCRSNANGLPAWDIYVFMRFPPRWRGPKRQSDTPPRRQPAAGDPPEFGGLRGVGSRRRRPGGDLGARRLRGFHPPDGTTDFSHLGRAVAQVSTDRLRQPERLLARERTNPRWRHP